MDFFLFQDSDSRWYWKMRSADMDVVAKCASGFSNVELALDAIRAVREGAVDAPILNVLGHEDLSMSSQFA
ncbi:DUF1508 domain-containing protein [Variovorax sp. RHLX14]|uniref:DUF1508 domain-containing protein n=1 Tax=Variovorax sp. RHLX14 TaxID=1259731 RepID=UPI003F48D719